MQIGNYDESECLTDYDLMERKLDLYLKQQLTLTRVKEEHNQFLTYFYFDADKFMGEINVRKSHRLIEDDYSESLYNLFVMLAEIKNKKEQSNNIAWIKQASIAIRPDIFNASLSQAVISVIDQKLEELKSEDNPLFNLQYVNYTQRLNQNDACIHDVEFAKNDSLTSKTAKPLNLWKQAMEKHVSVNDVHEEYSRKLH